MAIIADNQVMATKTQTMISSSTKQHHVRIGHFIEPLFPSHVSAPNIPREAFTSNSNHQNDPILSKPKFIGWQTDCPKWEEWIFQMHEQHKSTWKMAGIYDAIMSSAFHINRDDDLMIALARKWFPETNTFVFKWREQSVTLEDVCVLGGYSVLGESVSDPSDTTTQNTFREANRRLCEARKVINNTSLKKVTHTEWINLFTTPNRHEFYDVKHEAFLVFWLSKFVFPRKYNTVGKHVHNLAIRLSRGTRIALAPAVLASIYKDLTTLKREISTISGNLIICSPMHLVAVWAWERFELAKPDITVQCQQIIARWKDVNPPQFINIANTLETRLFWLRPYERFFRLHEMTENIYRENGRWVFDCSNLEADIKAFVKIVRPSELVGLDCIEQYLPHRVARQFGFDQDIPGQVARFNQNKDVAWACYDRPFSDQRLYIPSRFAQTEFSARFIELWTRSRAALVARPL